MYNELKYNVKAHMVDGCALQNSINYHGDIKLLTDDQKAALAWSSVKNHLEQKGYTKDDLVTLEIIEFQGVIFRSIFSRRNPLYAFCEVKTKTNEKK